MNEFEMGDVLGEMCFPQKWWVKYTDSFDYHLKACPPFLSVGVEHTTRAIGKDEANHRFVKIGRWDWKECKEISGNDPLDI